MYVARILYPVEVLGPGKRVGIWFCGCPRRCRGCSNPELWEFQNRYKTTPADVFRLIQTIAGDNVIDGFTVTGGEPFYQPDELDVLLHLLKTVADDILVYTGYRFEQLNSPALNSITVLIDGEYVEERNVNCILRGSDNQKIHILDEKYRQRYEAYCADGSNQIQNFTTSDGVISVGIHRPDFKEDLNRHISQKGLKKSDG